MLFRKKRDKKTSNIALMDDNISEESVKEKVTKIKEEDVEILMDNEEAISEKLGNASVLRKYAELGKIMFAMLKDVKKGKYPNVPWFTIASIAFALLYVLNPFDLVPDFIPGVGYIDDLAVLSIGMGWIETDLHKYLDWRLETVKSPSA
jgi:uncharacterized membrane protein YkvA (DUF1232 family)